MISDEFALESVWINSNFCSSRRKSGKQFPLSNLNHWNLRIGRKGKEGSASKNLGLGLNEMKQKTLQIEEPIYQPL